MKDIEDIRNCRSKGLRDAMQTERGINDQVSQRIRMHLFRWMESDSLQIVHDSQSVFSSIGSIDFPWSFSADIMHILLENIMKELLAIWEGKYKASMITGTSDGRLGAAAGEDYVISKSDWDEMDKDVSASNRTIPSQMARRMESVTKRGYWTAESYSYLLIHLGPIILKGRLGARYYEHYVKLSHPQAFDQDRAHGG